MWRRFQMCIRCLFGADSCSSRDYSFSMFSLLGYRFWRRVTKTLVLPLTAMR